MRKRKLQGLPVLILVEVLNNLMFLLQFFEFETIHFSEEFGVNLYKTSLRKDPYYITFYVFWSKVIFMEFLPYIVIIALNG